MEAFHNSVRNIDVVELWSGCQSICNAARLGGYVARPFDKHRSPGVTDVPGEHNEDITTKPGFNKALGLVLGLRENGLLWMAPVCSSFCWLNLSNTKRSKENTYRGATHSAVAKEGNKMALSAMLLAEVAIERGVQVVIENPPCKLPLEVSGNFNTETPAVLQHMCQMWFYWVCGERLKLEALQASWFQSLGGKSCLHMQVPTRHT